ncbi:hypothetical protein FMEXI_755 [Fusarium mexicanum]|uniref:Uncharacterized protein n=1 Tax=Fusarium mexicanum TaxID=751941 RepID=A0A8H5JMD9_9HYPO|nr:hypothetical protein FMEXI_755 [Fusarium mexicanum]
MDNSSQWRIPRSLSRDVAENSLGGGLGSIRRIWFGFNNDYVVEMDNTDYLISMKNYGGLEDRIYHMMEEETGIKQLAMNIEDSRGYILIKQGGGAYWNVGSDGGRFDEPSWQKFKDDNQDTW